MRGTIGGVRAAAGQHATIELRRLERDVREVRREVGAMLTGAGGCVKGAQARRRGAEQGLQRFENGGAVTLGRLIGEFETVRMRVDGIIEMDISLVAPSRWPHRI